MSWTLRSTSPASRSRCTVLRSCYAMSGTDLTYAAISSICCLRACYALSGTDVAYAATLLQIEVWDAESCKPRYLPTRLQCDVRY
eukprot:1361791-Rhodomonas_salina.8